MSQRGALIGFGAIAETTHVGALQSAGLEIVAVVETSPSRSQAALRVLPDARIYHDVPTLLQHEALDFVDICTPPHAHFEAAQLAIHRGLHVLCEKPLVLKTEQAEHLTRLASIHGVVVTCVHNWIYAPILLRAHQLLQSQLLGPLQHMDVATWRTQPAASLGDQSNWRIDPERAGGGILFDHGWHGMSLLLRIIGTTPLWVRGKVEKKRYESLSVEDTCDTMVEFTDGVTGRFRASWAHTERRNDLTLHCQMGRIEVCNDTLRVLRADQCIAKEVFEESLAKGGYRPGWTAGIVREFTQEIQTPEMQGTSLREALLALQMIMATYESSRSGGMKIPIPSARRFNAQVPRAFSAHVA